MKNKRNIAYRPALYFVSAIFLIITLSSIPFLWNRYATLSKDVDGLALAAMDDPSWGFSQLNFELQRFQVAILETMAKNNSEAYDNLRFRQNILYSRIEVIYQVLERVKHNNDVGLTKYIINDDLLENFKNISTSFNKLDIEISNFIESHDLNSAHNIFKSFQKLTPSVASLASRSNLWVQSVDRKTRQLIKEQVGIYQSSILLMLGSLLGFLILVFFMFYHLYRANRILVMEQDKAKVAERAKTQFLASMNHELRTPLTSSIGSLGLLNSIMADKLSNEGRELVEIALRNNKTLLRLVNEILDYEKLKSGTLLIETQRHDICSLTANTIHDLQGYADSKSVNFVLTKNLPPIYSKVNEYRFQQVLNNLLSNAAKFSAPGRDVEISVEQENKNVYVKVKDHGPGIPLKFKSLVFEQFTQVDSSSTREHSGTGLGLAISKVLTEGMSGTLDFESEVGVGSTFYVCLPVCE